MGLRLQAGGGTFTLYLPRVSAMPPPTTGEPARPDLASGRGHVLLVEDNEQVGQFSTELLSEFGFETSLAANGEAALESLERYPGRYVVVFSDVVMPGMGGFELAKELRRRTPDLPVVLTSGYSHVLAQETSHGFQILHKPYSVEDLARVLGDAIRRL